MAYWEHYFTPTSVEEALRLLAEYKGLARIVGGGTDLILEMQQGHRPPVTALVDLSRVPGLDRISQEGDYLVIGAAVTHTRIVQDGRIARYGTCLVESCGVIGGPQVRNVGTLGGNVAHALPAGDGTTSLVALGAEALVAWADGRREWLPIGQMFKGPGVSALDSSKDVLVAFRFRLSEKNEGSAFKRIMRPQGVALPILGCAIWVRLTPDHNRFDDLRICIGPVSPTPSRAEAVEAALRGSPVGADAVERAVSVARETLHPRTSKYRATGEYRVEMIDTLLRRALPLAVERARTGVAHAEGVGLS